VTDILDIMHPMVPAKRLRRLKAQLRNLAADKRRSRRVRSLRPDGECVLTCGHANYYGKDVGDSVCCIACGYLASYEVVRQIEALERGLEEDALRGKRRVPLRDEWLRD
jgi:hypothetical protein